MTLQRQLRYWAIALVVLVFVLYFLSGVLFPFIAAMALAYLLDPLADCLERLGMGRISATAVIIGAAILVFAVMIAIIVPILGDQFARLAARVPGAVSALEQLLEQKDSWLRRIVGEDINLQGQLSGIAQTAIGWIGGVFQSVWDGGMALLGLVSLFVITPVVAFYLLVDWDRMIAQLDSWLPRQHADTIREIVRDIDKALAGFVRGQGTVCLLLGAFYGIALTVAGLQFGLLIGLFAGLISFVPYIGSIVGLILSVGMAVAQTWPGIDWVFVAIVAAIFGFGQFVEGNILSPRLIGSSVGLHPVWMMFALVAFGYLFGFVGMLVAVPLAAVVGVVSRFMLRQYLASRLYLGPDGEAGERPTPSSDAG